MAIAERAAASPKNTRIDRLRDIAGDYHAFVVDVWGVICDGKKSFPRAVKALREMRACAPVLLLSNTARRSHALSAFLRDLGIGKTCYDIIMTAGELCHSTIRQRNWTSIPSGASDIWYLGPERDRRILAGTGLAGLSSADGASAVLCTGLDPELPDVASHRACLMSGLKLELPFLCANPDREVFIGSNKIPCAGALADLYEDLGGRVVHFGKPEPSAYQSCLDELQRCVPLIKPAQVLAIGDGMATDILGASRFGMTTMLIEGPADAAARVNQVAPCQTVFPDFIQSELNW